eukprot:226831-Prymnesium_polylepis.1
MRAEREPHHIHVARYGPSEANEPIDVRSRAELQVHRRLNVEEELTLVAAMDGRSVIVDAAHRCDMHIGRLASSTLAVGDSQRLVAPAPKRSAGHQPQARIAIRHRIFWDQQRCVSRCGPRL